ncbi:MAG TPA: beta-propeller fold lactonase family protein [Puia sp.]|nr:beta-propeller fold lactonase family protein [Puia sp.]
MNSIRPSRIPLVVFTLMIFLSSLAQPPAQDFFQSKRVKLPNGWSLTPAGRSMQLGDLPLNLVVSHSGKLLAVSNDGQGEQSLELIDIISEHKLCHVPIPKSWYGLAFSRDDRFLYASGGNDNCILQYEIAGGSLFLRNSISLGMPWMDDDSTARYLKSERPWRVWRLIFWGVFIASAIAFLAVRVKRGRRPARIAIACGLFAIMVLVIIVALWRIHRVHAAPEKISPAGIAIDDNRQRLYVVTKENNSLYIVDTGKGSVVKKMSLGGEGYACTLSPDGNELYLSCWGCNQLMVYDTQQQIFVASIAVGGDPNDICLSPDGHFLYVANANDNSVSVIDVAKRKVIETLQAGIYPGALPGSTTNGLALDVGGKTLYVSNADNNCISVFDVSKPGDSQSLGFIPVGWYPTAIRITGKKLFVANARGFASLPDPLGPNPASPDHLLGAPGVQFIGSLFTGGLSIIDEPDAQQLAEYTGEVYANTPYSKSKEKVTEGEDGNPVPKDFRETSPIRYVFYIIKENRTYDQVLGDMRGGNGDSSLVLFGEKITPNQHALAKEFVLMDNFYCDAAVSEDGHSWSMGAYADDFLEKTWPTSYGGRGGNYDGEGNRKIANNQGGYLWDACARAGLSYRTYGEFVGNPAKLLPVLRDHVDWNYPAWDLSIRDTVRERRWEHDVDSLLKRNAVPRFSSLHLGGDHTEALQKGKATPFAHVADNDLAVGMFIGHLSATPIWKQSVVFILEDDAQNGPDHVDAHRSCVYVAGGLVKRHLVDHTLYSTSSVLRTIELILGLRPMSQYDAAATPLWRCFGRDADPAPFACLPESVNFDDKNTAESPLSEQSAFFDFRKEDLVAEDRFNEVLWKGIKGDKAPLPAPSRAAFVRALRSKDQDD